MAKTICPVCNRPVGMWAAYDHPDTTVTHVACQFDYRNMLAGKHNGDPLPSDDEKIDACTQGALVETAGNANIASSDTPGITVIFYLMAAFSILVGFFLCVELMPGEPPRGREWTIHAYVPSIASFVAGCVQAAIFAAIGKGLHYLDEIAGNTRKSLN